MSLTLGIIASSRGNIVPPLDTFGGAAAAYSTRLLSSAYGGSAVRVRRSFDNAEQDIGFSGGAIDETALMNFVGYQNLFQQSQTFEDAYWIKQGINVSPNTITAPDGTLTGESIISNSNAFHAIYRIFTGSNTTHTASVYVKAIAGSAYNWVLIGLYNGTSYSSQAYFNVVTGEIGNVSAGTVIQPVNVGNGWWRIVLTGVLSSAANCEFNIIPTATNGGSGSYIGDGTSGLYLWGAQLNVGTTAQPYQVTTSAARSGDGFVTKWYTQDSNWENLLLQSQTFENASWTKNQSTIAANVTTAPDGTLTGESFVPTTVSAPHFVIQPISKVASSLTYTVSAYVKPFGYNFITLGCTGADNTNQTTVSVDLTTLSKTNFTGGVGFSAIGSSVTAEANGWFRVSLTFSSDSSISIQPVVRVDNTFNNAIYAGNGTSGIYIWGAQLSQGSWLQPYQVTTTAAILRRDASQSTAANQPRIVGGGVIERENGKASIRFDGVSDRLLVQSPTPFMRSNPTSVISVFSPLGFSSQRVIFDISNNRAISLDVGGVFKYYRNLAVSTISTFGDGIKSVAVYDNGTTPYFSSNGITYPITNPSFTAGADLGIAIGSTAEVTPTLFFNSDISEVLLYPVDQTSNRSLLERNVGAYYQTQWTGASSGLLDQFGGAAAAYSLRNLSSSYRGPLIRVRRSSDNAETDIGGTYNGDLDVASLLSFTGGQNLLTNSEDFTNALWIKTGTAVTANATIAPDGTLTADKFTETAVTSFHELAFSITLTSIQHNLSFYAKAAERRYMLISLYNTTGTFNQLYTVFDLVNGNVVSNNIVGSSTLVSSSIQSVGNGWYRCSITGSINRNDTYRASITILASEAAASYLGVVGSGVYIWGAQLNTGILQPYIPTTTAAVNGANAFVTKWYTQDANYQNLVLQSQTFENASWAKSDVTISQDSIVAPDGSLTADTVIENTANSVHQLSQTVTTTANQTYTYSVYVKLASGSRYLGILPVNSGANGNNGAAVFDLVNGAFLGTATPTTGLTGNPFTSSDVSIQSAGNGWWRLSVRISVAGTSYGCALRLYNAFSNGTSTGSSYTGDGTSGVFLWGAQLNEGTLVPYTATTTTVSQRRDAIQATAANQPRIVNAGGVESEGNKPAVFFPTSTAMFVPSSQSVFKFLHDGTQSTIVHVFSTTAGAFILSTNNGIAAVGYSSSTSTNGVLNSYIFGTSTVESNLSSTQAYSGQTLFIDITDATNAIAANRSSIYVDGGSAIKNNTATGTSSSTNAATELYIGNRQALGYHLNGTLNEILLYPINQTSVRQTIESNINSYYRIYWQGNGTALLDNYSGASAAYSLRNLSSAYTGPLIRVRRSNDNVERDIYGTFGGDLDIASLVAFVGANSGFVTTWYDQSGNARNATNGTAANQPRIVNAGVVDTQNGKPSVIFDGTNDFMSFTNLTATQFTSFYPQKKDANADISAWFTTSNALGGSPYSPVIFGTGGIYIGSGSNTYVLSSYQNNNYILMSGYMNSANQGFIQVNNVGISIVTHSEPNQSTVFNRMNARPGVNQYSKTSTPEMILYAFDNSANISAINSNINNYYKIY